MTFEEYCVKNFIDCIDLNFLGEIEFPTLDIATKVAEGLADGSNGFTFYVFQIEECDFYSVDCFLNEYEKGEEDFKDIYDGNVEVFKIITT